MHIRNEAGSSLGLMYVVSDLCQLSRSGDDDVALASLQGAYQTESERLERATNLNTKFFGGEKAVEQG